MCGIAHIMNLTKEEYVKRRHQYEIYLNSRSMWCTYIKLNKEDKRKLVSKKTYDEVINTLYLLYKAYEKEHDNSRMTLNKFYHKWIDHKRLHGIEESTITRYETDWKRFYLKSYIINKPMVELTKHEIDDWLHRIVLENHMTRKDYINVATIIKQSLDYAMELGIVEQNYARMVKIESRMFKPEKKKPSETQVYSEKEIQMIKELAWRDVNNHKLVYKLAPLAVLFMINSGLRVGETSSLKYSDIDGNYIHVQSMLARDEGVIKEDTKGLYGDRWVPLTKEAKSVISKSIELHKQLGLTNCEYIFSANGNYMPHRAVNDTLRRYCKALEIPYRSSHKMRKTYISTLIDAGVNINTIREVVGHKDERTTLNCYCYDRLSLEERREKIERALNS